MFFEESPVEGGVPGLEFLVSQKTEAMVAGVDFFSAPIDGRSAGHICESVICRMAFDLLHPQPVAQRQPNIVNIQWP
jgi:hypothetical protein